jgi:flagellar biogenesis protein FliO
MGKKQKEVREEEQSNKRFSFILGMFIALAIIILFAILFPH